MTYILNCNHFFELKNPNTGFLTGSLDSSLVLTGGYLYVCSFVLL